MVRLCEYVGKNKATLLVVKDIPRKPGTWHTRQELDTLGYVTILFMIKQYNCSYLQSRLCLAESPGILRKGERKAITVTLLHLIARDSLLHLGVHAHHLVVQLGVVSPHDLGVPSHGNKDGVDTAGQGCGKDVGNLETDEESKGHNDGCEVAIAVVAGVGKEQVQVGKEGAGVGDEDGAKRQNRSDQAFLSRSAWYKQ